MGYLGLVTLIALASGGQDSSDAAPVPMPQFDPRAMEVQLADESVLKLLLADERIEIVTPHGTLFIPTDEIRRIEFAQRLPEETTRRIAGLMERLGNPDSETQEQATAELLELKEQAYLALVKATKAGDPQLAPRAAVVLKKLRSKLTRRDLALRDDDLIETAEAKVAGRIAKPALKVSTSQFGELALKLADARSLRHQSLAPKPPPPEPEDALPDPGNLTAYQGRIGQTLAFRVTGAVAGTVWGTDVYTTDSQLAMAAVHAGIVRIGETGVVRVKIIPSPPTFAGSRRNGILSQPYGRYPAAYQILKKVEE
jgi:LCCL domain-containing protein